MDIRQARILGTVWLLAWLPLAYLLLVSWQPIQLSNYSELINEIVEPMGREWALDLVLTSFGILAALLLLVGKRVWLGFGVVVTGWYLSQHHLTPIYDIFVRDASSVGDVVHRINVMSKYPVMLASVIYFDILFPALCLWVMVFAGLSLRSQRTIG
ncbi:MAG: hypothetical protein EPO06_01595 [Burkholderiaceae bacterium]|nr:MAG: hypothetical protein EPO06_01595 [Burkholderiaceae bacterium]